MNNSAIQAASRPAASIALTFVLMGLGYALPIRLDPHPPAHLWDGAIAPEVLNLYSLTAWMGIAHFFYAVRGQRKAFPARDTRGSLFFLLGIAVACGLFAVRHVLGLGIFSSLVWIYFLSHFAKAEAVFQGAGRPGSEAPSEPFWQPIVAFSLLTLVLFNLGGIDFRPWVLFGSVVAIAGIFLVSGGWKAFACGRHRFVSLAMFLLGECLVWGTYGRYMTPAFRVGVYVFHIAAASFFHYLGSYFFARSRSRDPFLSGWCIIGINVCVIVFGYASCNRHEFHWLTPFLGVEWFTLWVAWHLVLSDLFPLVKKRN